jgi:hypothetical protein
MGDVLLIAILVMSFALVIVLGQVISRMLESGTDLSSLANEAPDTRVPDNGNPANGVTGPLGWRT